MKVPRWLLLRLRPWLAAWALLGLVLPLAAPAQPAQARPRLAPQPLVTLGVPATVPIGADFSFTVSFSNTSGDPDDVGYGPIVDLLFPRNGADGAAGTDTPDGIDFVGASYLGLALPTAPVVLTFPDDDGAGPGTTGCVDHPFYLDSSGLPFQVCGTAGDRLVVLELPFGSFAPGQPAVVLTIDAALSNLADLGTPLTLRARGGFRFGADPLDNPCCDLVIVDPSTPDGTGWPSATVTPTLLTLSKTYSGPEDETATGPNFPRRYTITVSIADGQTITNLEVSDLLPPNMAYLGLVSSSHDVVVAEPPVGVPQNPPDNRLAVRFNAATGTAVVVFEYFIPEFDADGARVLPAASGDDRLAPNQAEAVGDWTPLDPRDAGGTGNAVAGGPGPEHVLNLRSIAIQKGAALVIDGGGAGPTPGDTVEYTLTFQVSDYFTFGDVVVTDVLSDGQRLVGTPTLSVGDRDGAVAGGFTPGSDLLVDTSRFPPAYGGSGAWGDGSTVLTYNVSQAMLALGAANGVLTGGRAISPDAGPATGTIRFRTEIQDEFACTFPSGDRSVDQGDLLNDAVTIAGQVYDNATQAPQAVPQFEDDGSGAGVSIARGSVSKLIFAVNGAPPAATVRVSPGDEVTYRIRYSMPSSDVEDLYFVDYLPLPVFRVTDPDGDGAAGPAWAFDPAPPGGIPAAGTWSFGPADTFSGPAGISGITPALAVDASSNSLTFTYGNFDDPLNQPSAIDLLFTLAVTGDPFADGLFLTNQVRQHEGSTNSSDEQTDVIIQIQIAEPYLRITKGVMYTDQLAPPALFSPATTGPVAFLDPTNSPRWAGTISSDGLDAAPVDSDLSGVDAGDLVSFAIVVENRGSSANGAFDIRVVDTLPDGFEIPAGGLNLQVFRGDGTPVAYTALGPNGDERDLFTNVDLGAGFGQGLELVDPGVEGACAVYSPGSGANLVILTYDLRLADDVGPRATLVNTAGLTQYASREGGPSFIDPADTSFRDTATVTVADPALSKTLLGTNQAHTTGVNVAIGEMLQYQLLITVPEGVSPAVTLVDTLDLGLAFVSLDSLTPSSAALTTDVAGGFPAVLSNATISNVGGGEQNRGRRATLNFGTLTNSDLDNATAETLTLTYTVVVINGGSNDRGDQRNNNAVWTWSGGSVTAAAPNVRIVEPTLTVSKVALPTEGDAGDLITFTITLAHTGASNADAFEVALADVIPARMTYVPGSLDCTLGVQDPLTCGEAGGVISAAWPSFLDDGTSAVLTFQVTLDVTVVTGQVLTNTAAVSWTSLPGDVTTAQTPNNLLSTERTGDTTDPGGADNDYRASGSATVTIFAPGPVKAVAATSEGHTSAVSGVERVAIGEIVRFRLTARVHEGTSPDLRLVDALPAGLTFLDDGTARVAFVADDPAGGIASSTLSGPGLLVSGDETSVDAITPTFVLPGSAILGGPFGEGADPTFALGTLLNSDDDDNEEFVVLEFNALTNNVAGNQAGVSRSNAFTVWVNGATVETSNAEAVVIAEPALTLVKAFTLAPVDAGDAVEFTLTATNATGPNVAAAFDLRLTDTLDPNLTLTGVSVVAPGYAVVTDNSSLPGGVVDVRIDRLDPGDSVVVTVSAEVIALAAAGQQIPNTADVVYTSLPGPAGTQPNPTGSLTPGGSGASTGERDGSGGVNDYAASDAADVTLAAPQIEKLTPDPALAPVGQVVVFNLRARLPEGVTRDLVVIDDLPAGLEYVSHQVITSAAASGGLLTADFNGTLPAPAVTAPGGSGGDLTLDFGDATTAADGLAENDQFLVRVSARLLNEAAVQNNATLTNIGRLTYTNPQTGTVTLSDQADLTVIEPELDLAKAVDDASPALGQELTYTLTLSHLGSSTADAFDLALSDVIPAGLTYVSGSLAHTAGLAPTTLAEAGGTVSATWNAFPLGSTSTLTYRVTVDLPPGANVGDVLTNDAALTWTSLAGAVAGERTGAGGIDDYRDADDVDVTVTGLDLQLVKTDGGVTAAPGDTITYTLTYRNVGNGAAAGVVISETVPDHTTFVGPVGWSCAAGAPAGSTCTYSVGALAAGAVASVDFTVQVITPLPAGVELTANTASITDDGSDGPEPTPDDNVASDTTPLVAAPDLAITKDDGVDTVAAGSLVTYTLAVRNNGDQDATGIEITDTVPAGTAFVPAGSSPGWACAPDNSAGSACTLAVGDLDAGDEQSFTFRLQVLDPLPGGLTAITNTAEVQDDGDNGDDPTPDDNRATDVDSIVEAPANLAKALIATSQLHTAGLDAAIGEIFTYQISLSLPAGTQAAMTLTDVLDRGMAFVECVSILGDPGLTTSLPGGFGDACNAPTNPTVAPEPGGSVELIDQGRRVVFELGDVANPGPENRSLVISYRAVVLDAVPVVRGVTLGNAVEWVWSGGTLAAAGPAVTAVEPTLTLEKTASPTVALPGTVITFTLRVGTDPTSDADAFDLLLTDSVPVGLTYLPGSLAWTGVGVAPDTIDDSDPIELRAGWDAFPIGSESELRYQATLGALGPGSGVSNEALLEWTSLPDDDVAAPFSLSPFNALATERYYDPPDPANVYGVIARAEVRVPALPATGFAPGRVTALPQAPPAAPPVRGGAIALSIPALGVRVPVVGVPTGEEGWDLTWLGAEAGYLEGTAYPTLSGNTALTGHVYLPDGRPGPFIGLGDLRWGDTLVLEAGGVRYLYQVRQVAVVAPDDLSALRHETLDWLTLITCQGYDPALDGYRWRVVVRAVRIGIE